MNETYVVAAIGATVSILDAGGYSYIKICRIWFTAFFLAVFLSDDAINIIQHLFSFTISTGGTVFMTAMFGSAIVERVLFFIKSFKLSALGYKNDS